MTLDASRDLYDALRTLRRSPALTAVIVVTLAVGIGVNAALFTLFRLVDRPLSGSGAAGGTVVRLETRAADAPPDYAILSYAEYVRLRTRATTLSEVAVSYIRPVVVSSGEPSQVPPLVLGDFVSDSYFAVFNARLARGRAFTRDEVRTPGETPVAVLSHAFWQRDFSGREDIIGQRIMVNATVFTVVGIMAADFVSPGFNWRADLWLPVTMRGRLHPETMGDSGMNLYDETDRRWLAPFARLAPGRTFAEARAEIRVLMAQRHDTPAPQLAPQLDVTPVTVLGAPGLSSSLGRMQALAMAATAIVLLIVCTNVASLLLARAVTTRKEMAVRVCLGAPRSRLLRRLFVESAILAALGGAGGLLLAWGSLRAFLAMAVFSALGRDELAPIAHTHVTPDVPVLAFTLGVSSLACLLCGLLPAWRATSGDPLSSLKDATGLTSREGGRSRLRSGLVVAQAALSLVLVIATGLLARGLDRVQRVEPSVDPNRTLLLTVWMRQAQYDVDRAQLFFRDLDERLRALPGVRAVARAENVPGLEGEETIRPVDTATTDGSAAVTTEVRGFANRVSAGYFDVLDRAIVRGRAFTEQERDRGDAVVITESLAHRLWPHRDPLGQRLAGPTRDVAHVVGIARDATDLFGAPRALLYVPLDPALDAEARARVVVRTSGDGAALLSAVAATAHAVDPALHITVETMATHMAGTSTFRLARTASVLAASMALLALALASLGVYGVMAFMVSRRTREIGVRMALGAERRDVRRLVLGHGLRLGLVGVALGLAGGAGVGRLLSSLLFGVSPVDPLACVGASVLLLAIIFAACLIPARRATHVNPLVSLRHE